MMREDIKHFLANNKDKTKLEVVSLFTTFVLVDGISVDKLAKLIGDLRSYPEWIWGE